MEPRLRFYRAFALTFYGAAIAAFAAATALLVDEALAWLRAAHASGYSNAQLLHDAGILTRQMGQAGLQRIMNTLLNWPAWSGLLTGGLALFSVGSVATSKIEAFENPEQADQ